MCAPRVRGQHGSRRMMHHTRVMPLRSWLARRCAQRPWSRGCRHFCLNSETATGVLSSSRKADLPPPHLQKLLHRHLLLSIPLLLGLEQVFRSSKARAHSASRRSRHKYLTSSFGHASSEGRYPIRLQLPAGNHDGHHGGLGWPAPLAPTALRQFSAFFIERFSDLTLHFVPSAAHAHAGARLNGCQRVFAQVLSVNVGGPLVAFIGWPPPSPDP